MNSGDTSNESIYDIFIAGGGINGCGIARAAQGSGFSVCLAEMGDLGSATSSGSTKLIHGGLRYLEHYDFKLVRKALIEREKLWAIAPHIIHPLRFILPLHKGMRPGWIIRLGLFIYDHLGGRKLLPGTRTVNLMRDPTGEVLKDQYVKGFEYSDCWVDDARLVVLNARDAANRGAEILPQTRVISAQREKDIWVITTRDQHGEIQVHRSRLLINATGPWVDNFLTDTLNKPEIKSIRLVRGSHIVVNKLFDHDRCYIFQNADGRIVFAIPYEEDYTLIGTTDCDFEGDPRDAKISAEETAYLCESVNNYFKKQLTPADIIWSYSAVRPLFDDGNNKAQAATRDYSIKTESIGGKLALLNIYGGKITTYRELADKTMQLVGRSLNRNMTSWSATAPLPGGDFAVDEFEKQVSLLKQDYAFLSLLQAKRLIRLYGTRARVILGETQDKEDMGRFFGGSLFEVEVRYLIEQEWAVCAEDILWRRTKEGLRLSATEIDELERFVTAKCKSLLQIE
ncbi:MAG: glycerol-3-phosphate dehydrogenase [Parasphingorhabdus sp.]|jgi:glycerol-3-phosphate dehydrogenase